MFGLETSSIGSMEDIDGTFFNDNNIVRRPSITCPNLLVIPPIPEVGGDPLSDEDVSSPSIEEKVDNERDKRCCQ